MASQRNRSPAAMIKRILALKAGLQTQPPGDLIKVGGKTMTVGDYITQLTADAATYQAVINADKLKTQALQARDAAEPAIEKRCSTVISALKVALGPENPELLDYGITPAKERQPVAPATKLAATQKALATRKARHTMGAKQKQAITGSTPPPPPESTPTPPVG